MRTRYALIVQGHDGANDVTEHETFDAAIEQLRATVGRDAHIEVMDVTGRVINTIRYVARTVTTWELAAS
jgi:hypothetical protein